MSSQKWMLSALIILMTLTSAGVLPGGRVEGVVTVRGGTFVGGNISTDTVWDGAGSPYVVSRNLTVLPGATLKILPGVVINCTEGTSITVLGNLTVLGEAGREVIFQANGTGVWGGILMGGEGWMNHTIIRGALSAFTIFNNSTYWLRYTQISQYSQRQLTCRDNSTLYLLATPVNDLHFNITGGRVYEMNPLTVKVLKDRDMTPFEGAMIRLWGDGKLFFASQGWGGNGPKTNSSGLIPPVAAPYRIHEGRLNLSAVSIRAQAFAMDLNHTWSAIKSGIIADEEKEVTLLFDFTPPPMPQNFTIGNVTGHSVDLHWELRDPDAYQVQILMNMSAGPNDFNIIARALPDDGFYRVEGLSEETTYYFRLRASDIVPNYSPFTPILSATTLDVTPPAPPENLTAVPGENYLLISWEPSPSDDVMNYSVYLNSTLNLLANLSSSETTYNITGLSPDTEYTVLVVAWDDAGLPSTPETLNASTLDVIPPPAPLYNYTFLEDVFMPSSGIVNVSGVLITGRVPGEVWALVMVYRNDLLLFNVTAHPENFTFFVNFVPGENRIKMRAMDPSGNLGPFSEEVTFIYDPYPPEISLEGIPQEAPAPLNLSGTIMLEDSSPIHSVMWTLKGDGVDLEGEGEEITAEGLPEGRYTLTIQVRDVAGNLNVSTYILSVVPPDTTPPSLLYSSISPNEADVPLNVTIELRFSEAVLLGTAQLTSSPWGEMVPLNVSVRGETVIIRPLNLLSPATLYTLTVSGLQDLHGNTAPNISINFTTQYPQSDDYDSDGLPNSYEEMYSFLDPLNPQDASMDEDGDGLTNLQEYLNHTRPDLYDTDGDGYSDYEEILKGTNPLDKNDFPEEGGPVRDNTALYVAVAAALVVTAVIFVLLLRRPSTEEAGVEEEAPITPEVIEHSLMDDFVNCPECGAPVEKDAEYCPECGAILTREE